MKEYLIHCIWIVVHIDRCNADVRVADLCASFHTLSTGFTNTLSNQKYKKHLYNVMQCNSQFLL